MRVTRAELLEQVAFLNRILDTDKYYLGTCYRQCQLCETMDGPSKELSPRMPSGELSRWLEALILGVMKGVAHVEARRQPKPVEGVCEACGEHSAELVSYWRISYCPRCLVEQKGRMGECEACGEQGAKLRRYNKRGISYTRFHCEKCAVQWLGVTD